MVVAHLLPPVLAGDEVGDVRHRARAVERVHGDEVAEARGAERLEVLLHAVRLELEEAGRFAALEEAEGGGVVEGDPGEVHVLPAGFLDRGEALAEDRERGEAEEVHLQQADRLHVVPVVLRRVELAPVDRRRHHRNGVHERIAGDDDAAGVDAGLAEASVDALGNFEDAPHHRDAVLPLLREFRRGLVGVGEVLDGGARRNEVHEAARVRERVSERLADVADAGLGRHRAERDDVRHVVGAVLFRDVVHHLAAERVLEVLVDVRHGDAVRVEEALEEQVVRDGVDVGDTEAVRHGGAGRRAAARAHENAHLLRGVDVVVDDEEVAREAHVADRVELEFDPLPLLGVERLSRPAPRGALQREVAQVVGFEEDAPQAHVAVRRPALEPLERLGQEAHRDRLGIGILFEVGFFGSKGLRNREHRHDRRTVQLVFLDLRRDFERVGEGLRVVREERCHFVAALEPLLPRVAQALRVGFERLRGKAEQDVVRLGVLLEEEVRVVRRDDLDAEPGSEGEDLLVDAHLVLVEEAALAVEERGVGPVEHDFEVVVVAEDGPIPLRGLLRAVVVSDAEHGGDLPGDARGRADEALVVRLEERLVDARPSILALDVGEGNHADEVLVSRLVLRQKDQVVPRKIVPVESVLVLVRHRATGHVGLASEDRLHRGERVSGLVLALHAEVVEGLEAVQDAVVRDGEGRNAELPGARHEGLELAHPVEERIRRVDVQRDERGHAAGSGSGNSRSGEKGGRFRSLSESTGSRTGQGMASAGEAQFTPPSSPAW